MSGSTPSFDFNAIVNERVTYENRVRELMSAKDKALDEKKRFETELEQLRSSQQALQTGAQTIAEQAIQKARELEIRLEAERAERMKAQALMQKPHLAAYAPFLPTTSDPAALAAAIEQIEAVRQADLTAYAAQAQAQAAQQTQQAQQGAYPPAPGVQTALNTSGINLAALYPQNGVPPMAPARVAPSAAASSSASVEAELRTAMEAALRSGDYSTFEAARDRAAQAANLSVQQQGGFTR